MAETQHTLSLAAGVLPEHTAETLIHAAAASGWDAVGIMIDPDLWTDGRAKDVRRRIEDKGLGLVDTEVIWLRPGPMNPAHLRTLDIAAILGSPNFLVVSSDPDVDATTEKFAALCDHAAPSGMNVSLEFFGFTSVRCLADARRIVEGANRPNGRILVDNLHFARSGGTPEELAAAPQGLFSYTQLCDATVDGPHIDDSKPLLEEAIDGRLIPGEGGLPLAEIMKIWRPDLPLSVELRSKPLRDAFPDPTERARHLLNGTRAWLESLPG